MEPVSPFRSRSLQRLRCTTMAGAVILVVAMLVVLPAALFAAGAVWSAILGQALTADRQAGGPSPRDG